MKLQEQQQGPRKKPNWRLLVSEPLAEGQQLTAMEIVDKIAAKYPHFQALMDEKMAKGLKKYEVPWIGTVKRELSLRDFASNDGAKEKCFEKETLNGKAKYFIKEGYEEYALKKIGETVDYPGKAPTATTRMTENVAAPDKEARASKKIVQDADKEAAKTRANHNHDPVANGRDTVDTIQNKAQKVSQATNIIHRGFTPINTPQKNKANIGNQDGLEAVKTTIHNSDYFQMILNKDPKTNPKLSLNSTNNAQASTRGEAQGETHVDGGWSNGNTPSDKIRNSRSNSASSNPVSYLNPTNNTTHSDDDIDEQRIEAARILDTMRNKAKLDAAASKSIQDLKKSLRIPDAELEKAYRKGELVDMSWEQVLSRGAETERQMYSMGYPNRGSFWILAHGPIIPSALTAPVEEEEAVEEASESSKEAALPSKIMAGKRKAGESSKQVSMPSKRLAGKRKSGESSEQTPVKKRKVGDSSRQT